MLNNKFSHDKYGDDLLLITMSGIMELSRRMRRIKPSIDDELRGWNWHQPPLLHAYPSVNLPISDIYSEVCRCGALVHIKHNLKACPKLPYSVSGTIAHNLWIRFHTHLQRLAAIATSPMDLAQQLLHAAEEEKQNLIAKLSNAESPTSLQEKIDEWIKALWYPMIHLATAEYIKLLTSPAGLPHETIISWLCPMVLELKIDGSLLGFSSNCRLDGLAPLGLVLEIKTGRPNPIHELALTAYALAIESYFEIPIDYGMILYLSLQPDRPVCTSYIRLVTIDEKLRLDALEERDRMCKIVADGEFKNPTKPCGPLCPLTSVTTIV
ncbi:MAG: type I-A CRISPR-associated protein Cas4/Csa1 [Nitrososphaerota archaeon]